MSNPRSTLVEVFRSRYTEELSSEEMETTDIEHLLKKIEVFHRIGWESNTIHHINKLERKTEIAFEELAKSTPVEDPR